jgi:RNA polymerase sigma-70 factor (ECF subfamily)
MPSISVAPKAERLLSEQAQQDLIWIQDALTGEPKAYEKLLHRYQKPVYYLVQRMVRNSDAAEDLTIEVFAKAFRYLSRYQATFAFSTWLFRIATNHCIDFIRRKTLPTQSLSASLEADDEAGYTLQVPDPNPNPQEMYIRRQRMELVRQGVDRLPTTYAHVVRLRYFDELSYDEVATELQLPLGTVKAQLHRARELLLAIIEKGQAAL